MEKDLKLNTEQTISEMERMVELALLYDFYGELLKEHQKVIFEDYILNDLSLSEIAKEQGISRQGVHDTVKRCREQLQGFEEKLGLINKFRNTKDKVNEMKQLAEKMKASNDISLVCRIEEICGNILEEL